MALVFAASASACGVGDKQRDADRIHASRVAVADSSPAIGKVSFELVLDDSGLDSLEGEDREQVARAIATARAAGNPTLLAHTGLDARADRATVAFDATPAE